MSSTTTYQQMEPYSFGYQRVSIDKRYDKPPVIYRGPDVVENFIRHLLEEEKEIRDILSRIEPMIITEKSSFYRFFAIFKQFTSNFNKKNLADEGQKHFNYLSKTFPDPDVFSLLLRKGVFPYDYVDTEQKLEKPCLPSKEDFFNKLGDTHISDEDYQFAQTVWDKLKVKTLGEYSDVYLKMDVALLADVFEKFRDISLHDYDLDPCHYFTTPGFSWSAMLKKTGIVLDLITDIDMMLFCREGNTRRCI
ncbi:Hypothetical predicted protein [Mytilus galloprovincialis]|uniref:DNA-directed DNA polymerase n=1 Tax=Mytilus galloprovincialis TaxID=29158 RepID=A0A8B6BYZ7_MYTGA|nr:Hypothetical predicted protein [Mytilus galloprovincialis]